MRNKMKRKERGRPLIALVITIIVLLILAGVAISMLSGENGILRKAAEAKTKTEQAQKEEDTTLTDMEIDSHFITKNYKYKCKYGFITGFAMDGGSVKDKISDLEGKLPDGYKVTSKYNASTRKDEEITDKNEIITTGMAITKNGKEVARTVVFGDVNCNGELVADDAIDLMTYMHNSYTSSYEIEPYQKVAGNVEKDGDLNEIDAKLILRYVSGYRDIFKQDQYATSLKETKRNRKKMQELIGNMPGNSQYTFEYNEEDDTYKLKGVAKGTTVGELKSALPDGYEIKISKGGRTPESGDENEVTSSHKVYVNFKYTKTFMEFDDETGEEYPDEIDCSTGSIPVASIEVK